MNAPENRQLQKSLDLAFESLRAEAPLSPKAPPLTGDLQDARHIGQSIPRPNIERLAEGRGQYVDDIELPRMAHVVFWRSPVAPARIIRLERDYARMLPAVLAVVAGRLGVAPARERSDARLLPTAPAGLASSRPGPRGPPHSSHAP